MTAGQWRVVGHTRAIEDLERALPRPPHAYLLLGPRRVGKTTAAVELAKALNCLGALPPCQECENCRLIGQEGHADVSMLLPNEKDHIGIDQARALRQEIALRPTQARFRVIIMAADRLTEPAADALLKTLEEPPEQAILILTGHDLSAIPETVVSRCRVVAFGTVSTDEIEQGLRSRGIEPDAAAELAGLAFGSPGWAFEAAEDGDVLEQRRVLRGHMERWLGDSLSDRLAVAEELASGKLDRSRALALEELEILLSLWRDNLVGAACARPDLVARGLETLTSNREVTPAQAVSAIRAVSVAATRITENVEPRLALEALAVSL